MTLTTATLHYLGGLFDGEGCVIARLVNRERRRPTYRITVSLCMTSPDLVQFFQKHFGGQLVMRKKYASHHKQAYQWLVNDLLAYKFLVQLRPYVCLKARQFDVAMALQERVHAYTQSWTGPKVGMRLSDGEMSLRSQIAKDLYTLNHQEDPLGTLTIGANSAETCDGNAELNGVQPTPKCVTSIYPTRKGRRALALREANRKINNSEIQTLSGSKFYAEGI